MLKLFTKFPEIGVGKEDGGVLGKGLGKVGLRIRSGIGGGGVCGGRKGEGRFCWAAVGGVGEGNN